VGVSSGFAFVFRIVLDRGIFFSFAHSIKSDMLCQRSTIDYIGKGVIIGLNKPILMILKTWNSIPPKAKEIIKVVFVGIIVYFVLFGFIAHVQDKYCK
jgi:hypothetical protein